jgi:hypothetical protein
MLSQERMHMDAAQHELDWAEHIARWESSKLTRAEYCMQHNLKFNHFLYRLKRHRQKAKPSVAVVSVANQPSPISREEWIEHVSKWRTSGLTRIAYCRQENIPVNSFIYQVNRSQETQSNDLTLVPVKVRAVPAGGELVLRSPKGWSLAMASDVSAAWLSDLLGRLP